MLEDDESVADRYLVESPSHAKPSRHPRCLACRAMMRSPVSRESKRERKLRAHTKNRSGRGSCRRAVDLAIVDASHSFVDEVLLRNRARG